MSRAGARGYEPHEGEEHEGEEEDEEGEGSGAGLSIPTIRRKEEEEGDGFMSVFKQVDAFSQMLDAGSGWGSALVAAIQGHQMTEEQAALCIQSHWRKHEAFIEQGAKGMAAEFIQNVYRKKKWRRKAEAAMERGRAQRAYYDQIERENTAATTLNAAWRGHMDRERVKVLRARKRSSIGGAIRRSLSFGKKKGTGGGTANGVGADDDEDNAKRKEGIGKRIRRSMSFDRKGSGGGSAVDGDGPKMTAARSTRRTFVLERGPQGLGLELDATNTVVTIKPGGRAERQGLLVVGDTVLTIDGKSCAGALMQDVMVPGRQCYVVEVSRPEMVQATPTPGSGVASRIRRSMSFDKKAASGIKRSFSFTRKAS